ncbi:MAG: hypothetical protein V7731_06545 [Amphritea sp.]
MQHRCGAPGGALVFNIALGLDLPEKKIPIRRFKRRSPVINDEPFFLLLVFVKITRSTKDGSIQFAKANDERLNSFEYLIDLFFLGGAGLWAYGLNNFRYDYNTKFIHPAWSVLMTESGFDQYETSFVYRREYKTPGVGNGNGKNVALALGNMLSIYARNKFPAHYALECLKTSGIYHDTLRYFYSRGLDKSDLFEFIQKGLINRRLASKVAA